jgi:peroxiredoxin
MIFVLALIAALPFSPDSTNQLVGTWLNRNQAALGVTQVVITQENGALRAHSWSDCMPTDCDQGVAELAVKEGIPTAVFHAGTTATTMYFVHLPNDKLLVAYTTEFQDRPDVKNTDHTDLFALFERQKPHQSDENASALLAKVGQAYGNLATAELQFDYTHESSDEATTTHSSSHTSLLLSSSGKWRGETYGSGERSIEISDGKTVWEYFPDSHQYIAFPVENPRNTIVDRYRSIAQTQGSATITGSGRLGDVDCTAVKIERPDSVRTLWIEPKTNFILKDDVTATFKTPTSFRNSHSVTTFSPVRRLLNGDEKLFSFDPEKVQAKPREQLRQQAQTKSVGTPAPDFTLLDLENRRLHLSEVKGRVVLLDFWATWCVPCREALPNLELLHRDFGDKGLLVLGVNTEAPKDQAAFLEKFGYTFRSLVDANETVKNVYGVGGIPAAVLIDKDGNIQMFDTSGPSYDSLRGTVRKMIAF